MNSVLIDLYRGEIAMNTVSNEQLIDLYRGEIAMNTVS